MRWDDLYNLDINTLRHAYVDLSEEYEQLFKENKELIEKYTELYIEHEVLKRVTKER